MMDGGAWVELFDATAHALDEAPDLVLLELAGASFAPVEQVPVAVTEDESQPGVFSEPAAGRSSPGSARCSPTPRHRRSSRRSRSRV
jgi:hypothetical protein